MMNLARSTHASDQIGVVKYVANEPMGFANGQKRNGKKMQGELYSWGEERVRDKLFDLQS